jgi:hypothetical protein
MISSKEKKLLEGYKLFVILFPRLQINESKVTKFRRKIRTNEY